MLFGRKLYNHFSRLLTNYPKFIMKKSLKTSGTIGKNPRPTSDQGNNRKSQLSDLKKYTVLPTPVKSDSDQKEYKVIQLSNGLVACLISDKSPILPCENSDIEYDESSSEGSDSESDGSESEGSMSVDENDESPHKTNKMVEQKMAAAGLCIGVGSFSDPKDVPGMAHFLEHMVFMGSQKYPKENHFDEFIKQNGGSDNASTDAETTVFYFECLEKHLEESLDIFSQFFIAPLMKKEAMTREREAIESEFQIAMPSDGSRKEQLLCMLAKQDSPVNSFAWGNLITLRDNIKDKELYKGVHEFRKRHYSAHRMTLAIQARLPMEELERYTLQTFTKVENNKQPADNFALVHKNVFDTPEFKKIYYVIPSKNVCQVDITWAFPSLLNKYKSKPQHILSFLIGDEGKGSLLSYLKKKLWVIGSRVGNTESGIEHNSLYSLFTVNLNLTEEGYDHVNDVIEVVFSYLKMLKQIGPQERIFKERQSISQMTFKFADEDSPVEIVEDMCEAMQFYPSTDYITGSELYFEHDPESIKMLLDEMIPEKVNIMLLKQKSEEETKNYLKEKWFGTQYLAKDIPENWMQQWKNAPIIPELSIPPPNSFITTDFTILPDVKDNPDYPKKIIEDDLIELWYRRDMKFKLPNAYYYFQLISPLAVKDVRHVCMLETLVNLLVMDIAEEIYPASSADLAHGFMSYERGLVVKVYGFNQKLPVLLDLIAKYLVNLSDTITEDMFLAIKDKLEKNHYNKLLKPSKLAKDIRLNLLANNNWHPVDCYKAMINISFEDVKTYCKEFFKSLYVKALVQGNVDETTAIKTVKDFVKTLNFSKLSQEERPQYQVVRLDKGEKCCRMKGFSENDTNSIITNYYQSDHYNIENSVILDLILMVIEEPLFDILRTKEQLGYHVFCSVRDTFGVLGYTITVNAQATKVTTQFVDERIEAFLIHTQSLLAKLDDISFENTKINLIKMKQCVDTYLKEEVDRNWSEITSGDYIFDRLKQEIEAIQKTDLQKVKTWWEAHNAFGNKENFRKLTIQIEGYKEDETESPQFEIKFLENDNEACAKGDRDYFIKNIDEFKRNLNIFNVK
ncbi:nardilysin [Anthonomus grandis grandis]|uniref:nardilysin n=1 Tax=Anthonomus grandis grandis TaxID=2921223 RepID=UPI002165857E|nr:nardilysin [Anthonomus grandis grandis]